jgi:hypothetical protein
MAHLLFGITCVVADFFLHSGFMNNITVLHAGFCTEQLVSLYSGWIIQLVNVSLAWAHSLNSLSINFSKEVCDVVC